MISNGKKTPHKNSMGILRTSDVSMAVFSDSANVAIAIPMPMKATE
jgi:hypothetical protein